MRWHTTGWEDEGCWDLGINDAGCDRVSNSTPKAFTKAKSTLSDRMTLTFKKRVTFACLLALLIIHSNYVFLGVQVLFYNSCRQNIAQSYIWNMHVFCIMIMLSNLRKLLNNTQYRGTYIQNGQGERRQIGKSLFM